MLSIDSFDLSDAQKMQRLEAQKTDKWHVFADGEVILKKGFVNKRKGLFARKRMLLLTTGPRLIYIDPVQMIKKGEIPWSPELRAEIKNFKIFFVHTVSLGRCRKVIKYIVYPYMILYMIIKI